MFTYKGITCDTVEELKLLMSSLGDTVSRQDTSRFVPDWEPGYHTQWCWEQLFYWIALKTGPRPPGLRNLTDYGFKEYIRIQGDLLLGKIDPGANHLIRQEPPEVTEKKSRYLALKAEQRPSEYRNFWAANFPTLPMEDDWEKRALKYNYEFEEYLRNKGFTHLVESKPERQ